jgi:thiol-disulfide isomerase/thioredoxin
MVKWLIVGPLILLCVLCVNLCALCGFIYLLPQRTQRRRKLAKLKLNHCQMVKCLMKPNYFTFLVYLLMLVSFDAAQSQPRLQQGNWRFTLHLNDSTELPFNTEVKAKTIDVINAGERISVDEINYSDDSVFIRMPVFDSEFRGKFSQNEITGNYLNHARKNKNVIPFRADYGLGFRFIDRPQKTDNDFSGKWEVEFAGDAGEEKTSVGEFKQDGNRITGTFRTVTGDYRYLQGDVMGNSFSLSCFDGSHAFLFTATLQPNGTLLGDYYSGQHWHDTWTAKRNEKVELANPDSLTFLKKGYDHLTFSFPDINGDLVSLNDKKFQHKVVIVQIMGTWCPNCMDETVFLAPFYKKYKDKGLEIIGLDFERIDEFPKAQQNLRRLKKRFDVGYTLLYAGTSDAEFRARALPMLNRIFSFPTTIFIDRNNKVRKIHTGFSGPATGQHYEKWEEDFTDSVEQLLKEK